MSKYLLDYRLKPYIKDKSNIIFTAKHNMLYPEIDGHPDILACNLGQIVVVENAYYEILKKFTSGNIVQGNAKITAKYPRDIAYNCAIVGNNLIGKIECLDRVIINYCKEKNINLIDVKQGYAKCSILKLNDEALIVSDISIYNTLKNFKNLKIMYVNSNDIFLSERYTGFIGGASGFIKDKLYFFGNYKKIKNYNGMIKFIEEEGVMIDTFIPDSDKLYDFGGIIEIKE